MDREAITRSGLIWFMDYPEGGKDAYVESPPPAETLQAPEVTC